jgi:hypothetical protein
LSKRATRAAPKPPIEMLPKAALRLVRGFSTRLFL